MQGPFGCGFYVSESGWQNGVWRLHILFFARVWGFDPRSSFFFGHSIRGRPWADAKKMAKRSWCRLFSSVFEHVCRSWNFKSGVWSIFRAGGCFRDQHRDEGGLFERWNRWIFIRNGKKKACLDRARSTVDFWWNDEAAQSGTLFRSCFWVDRKTKKDADPLLCSFDQWIA